MEWPAKDTYWIYIQGEGWQRFGGLMKNWQLWYSNMNILWCSETQVIQETDTLSHRYNQSWLCVGLFYQALPNYPTVILHIRQVIITVMPHNIIRECSLNRFFFLNTEASVHITLVFHTQSIEGTWKGDIWCTPRSWACYFWTRFLPANASGGFALEVEISMDGSAPIAWVWVTEVVSATVVSVIVFLPGESKLVQWNHSADQEEALLTWSGNSDWFPTVEFLRGIEACPSTIGLDSPIQGKVMGATYDLRACQSYLQHCCFPCAPNLSQQTKACFN